MPELTQEQKDNYRKETQEHINLVGRYLDHLCFLLENRAEFHDLSKFDPEEENLRAVHIPELRKHEFGSPQYYEYLDLLKSAVDRHNSLNSHHPEHYPNGIDGMDLIDLCEMWADWNAASDVQKNGNPLKSFEICKKRFNMSDQLYNIFVNTLKRWDNGHR